MGFVDSNLMAGEKVIYRTQLSKAIFILPAIVAILGLFVLAGALVAAFAVPGPLASLPMLIFSALFFLWIILVYIKFKTSEFAVTNKRVLIKVGFIRRESLETLLQKVEGIHVEEGLIGRMFKYGTIIIKGTGGTSNPFTTIDDPFEFRKKVQEQIERSIGHQHISEAGATDKVFCTHCGTGASEGTKFCGKCGKKIA